MIVDPYSWNTAIDACIDEVMHTGSRYARPRVLESLAFLLDSLKMDDDDYHARDYDLHELDFNQELDLHRNMYAKRSPAFYSTSRK